MRELDEAGAVHVRPPACRALLVTRRQRPEV
jgi:hypothetical protein